MNLIHQLPPEAHAAIAAIWQARQEREITTEERDRMLREVYSAY